MRNVLAFLIAASAFIAQPAQARVLIDDYGIEHCDYDEKRESSCDRQCDSSSRRLQFMREMREERICDGFENSGGEHANCMQSYLKNRVMNCVCECGFERA